MYHVDGLVIDGVITFIHPFRYLNDCLSFRSNDWLASVPLSAADPAHDRLVEAAGAVLAELPTPQNTAFHCELWITPDDRVVFCEIASRTGGAMIGPTVRYSFGLDLDREWLYAECGLPSTIDPPESRTDRPAGWLAIPPSNGILEHLPLGEEPGCVREVSLTGAPGQVFNGGVKSGLFLAGYVVAGDCEDDVAANLEHVAAWFAGQVRWRPVPERTP
jgi:biotin carboxylase